MPSGPRLDHYLVEHGLVETRSRAKAMIMAGDVLVNGTPERRAGHQVVEHDDVNLKVKPRFVSRGGEKLDHALEAFGIDVAGMFAADLGASTGGFSDCLLQRDAAKIYAIDVGHGQIDLRVRNDSRVVVMEKTNARYIESLPDPIDIVVIDVSFISLSLMFPVVAKILKPNGVCVPLIKPQFEAGRDEIGKGGVVRDSAIHRLVLERSVAHASAHGLGVHRLVASPLQGPAGNIEFLGEFRHGDSSSDLAGMIEQAMAEASAIGVPE